MAAAIAAAARAAAAAAAGGSGNVGGGGSGSGYVGGRGSSSGDVGGGGRGSGDSSHHVFIPNPLFLHTRESVQMKKAQKSSIFIYGTPNRTKRIWTKYLASPDREQSLKKTKK